MLLAVSDPPNRIAAIEDELDALAGAVERCRKTELVGRAVAVAGFILLGAWLWRGDGALLLLAIAACLGGPVLFGSTRTTRRDLRARMEALDAERAALIDARLSVPNSAA